MIIYIQIKNIYVDFFSNLTTTKIRNQCNFFKDVPSAKHNFLLVPQQIKFLYSFQVTQLMPHVVSSAPMQFSFHLFIWQTLLSFKTQIMSLNSDSCFEATSWVSSLCFHAVVEASTIYDSLCHTALKWLPIVICLTSVPSF